MQTAAISAAPRPASPVSDGAGDIVALASVGDEAARPDVSADGSAGLAFAQVLAASLVVPAAPAADPQVAPPAAPRAPAGQGAGAAKTATPLPILPASLAAAPAPDDGDARGTVPIIPPAEAPVSPAPAAAPASFRPLRGGPRDGAAPPPNTPFAVEARAAEPSAAPATLPATPGRPASQAPSPAPATPPIPPPVPAPAIAQAAVALLTLPAEAAPSGDPVESAPARPSRDKATRPVAADAKISFAASGAAPGPAKAQPFAAPASTAGGGPSSLQTAVDPDDRSQAPPPPAAQTPSPTDTAALTPSHAAAHPPPSGARAEAVTVPHLVSQIIQKLDAKVTRFTLDLTPGDLGRVGVKVEIGASGAVTAALSFDNPQAAAELRGRADELRSALAQAGFDLSDAGLSFDLSGGARQWGDDGPATSGRRTDRLSTVAVDTAEDLLAAVTDAAVRLRGGSASAVDIRI